jgi:hypothetical protein
MAENIEVHGDLPNLNDFENMLNLKRFKKIRFNPITFSENSNYCRESLLKMIWQDIAGGCQQNFCLQKFVDNNQQCFAFTPQAKFPCYSLNFH